MRESTCAAEEFAKVNSPAHLSLDCLIIAVVWVAAAILLNPFANSPFIDDWVYAWSVENLLDTGHLAFLDYCGSANPLQILWGALFCLPGGFSFSALRLSTCVSALICLIFLYLLMRQLGTTRQRGLLATAVVGFNPIFFILAYSFMTDVPLLASSAGALWMFLRAVQRQSNRWLIAAAAMCAAGCAIRLTGAVLPIAMTIALILHSGPWGRGRLRWLIPLTSLLVLLLSLWFAASHMVPVGDPFGMDNSPARRMMQLRWALPILPASSLTALLLMGWCIGLGLLPVLPAAITRRALMWGLLTAAALLGVALFAKQPPAPLSPGLTWALGEIGATSPLIPGYHSPAFPVWLTWLMLCLTYGLLGVSLWTLRPRWGTGEMVFAWTILGHLAMLSILWLFYDRYAFPAVIIVIVWFVARAPRIRMPIAWTLTTVLAIFTLLGVRDHMALNRALWDAATYATQTLHLAPAQVDGGYVVNGWWLYAHPQEALHDERGFAVVPGVNSKDLTPYQISLSPGAGARVLAEFPYQRLLGPSGKLYLLQRN